MSIVAASADARLPLRRAITAALIMVGAAMSAWWLTPTRSWYDQIGHPDLADVVPLQFGDWVASDKAVALMVNPELSEALQVTYSQTLSRLYVNRISGRRIMLSIALGLDQTYFTQLHHPEGCYRAQGFVVDNVYESTLNSPAGPIKLTRFDSRAQARKEPVSYWIRIGKWNARSWFEKNWAKIALSAGGYIADGLLFRVSEISNDPADSFRLQDQFMNDLIGTLTAPQRAALVGQTKS